MFKILSHIILKILGWKVVGNYPYHLRKSIVIMAPHTSMWDFIFGRLGFCVLNVPVRFLIKKEMFTFPFGGILKAMGGIPVDRGKRNNMIDYVASLYDSYDDLVVVITPEGTRKYTEHWKKGFGTLQKKQSFLLFLVLWTTRRKLVELQRYFIRAMILMLILLRSRTFTGGCTPGILRSLTLLLNKIRKPNLAKYIF